VRNSCSVACPRRLLAVSGAARSAYARAAGALVPLPSAGRHGRLFAIHSCRARPGGGKPAGQKVRLVEDLTVFVLSGMVRAAEMREPPPTPVARNWSTAIALEEGVPPQGYPLRASQTALFTQT
jgi:hypothetical protein